MDCKAKAQEIAEAFYDWTGEALAPNILLDLALVFAHDPETGRLFDKVVRVARAEMEELHALHAEHFPETEGDAR